jgi:hypothetical protein
MSEINKDLLQANGGDGSAVWEPFQEATRENDAADKANDIVLDERTTENNAQDLKKGAIVANVTKGAIVANVTNESLTEIAENSQAGRETISDKPLINKNYPYGS